MSLDVGAIAKGYATEQVAAYMESQQITGYLLNVGGNVRCVGSRYDGSDWRVGVENPLAEDGNRPYLEVLNINDISLVTSGNYQRYYEVDGVTYHHIIDSDTLMPATDFVSVSVLCKDSGLADTLSTALFVMSFKEGIELVENLSGVEAMWLQSNGEVSYSSGFGIYIEMIEE